MSLFGAAGKFVVGSLLLTAEGLSFSAKRNHLSAKRFAQTISETPPPPAPPASEVYQSDGSVNHHDTFWRNDNFWTAVAKAVPGFESDPALARIRGFMDNLKTQECGAGRDIAETGQQVLLQYEVPGLELLRERQAFPSLETLQALEDMGDSISIAEWTKSLATEVAPVARDELRKLLSAKEGALLDDDAPFDDLDFASPWRKMGCAFFGGFVLLRAISLI